MRDLLTLSEVSNFLKVPKSTIYKLARERRLPGHKVGKHWRYLEADIVAYFYGEQPPSREIKEESMNCIVGTKCMKRRVG